MEELFVFCVGILLIIIGILNTRGNINSIHWYNRTRITETNKMQYGRCVGTGTIICGVGLIISAILNVFKLEMMSTMFSAIFFITGFVFIVYGQIKYNRGFF